MATINLFPGDRVMWRRVEFTIHSTWQDGTADLWDDHYQLMQPDVKASEVERVDTGKRMVK